MDTAPAHSVTLGGVMSTTRSEILAAYDRLENVINDLLADPGPAVAGGQILRDQDGKPLPNTDVLREARFTLAHLRECRASILGQDLGNPN